MGLALGVGFFITSVGTAGWSAAGMSAPSAPVGAILESEGTVVMDLHAPTLHASTFAVGATATPTGTARTIKVNQCLSYTWQVKKGFACSVLDPEYLPSIISGTRVYLNYSGTWKLTPYRYVSSTNSAYFDYTLLPRPTLKTGMGSASAWTAVSASKPYWNPCDASLTWKADFTALKQAAHAGGYSDAAVAALVTAETNRLKSALETLGATMGRTFTYAGESVYVTNGDATPDLLGTPGQPDIIITYGTNGNRTGYETGFPENTVGRGGSWYLMGLPTQAGGTANMATAGFATFDYRYVLIASKNPFRASGVDPVRALYLHELSHVMGLGHVSDSLQMMVTTADPRVDDRLGAGDSAGLGALAHRSCFK